MMWPSSEGQEARNAYTDWLLREQDRHVLEGEQSAEDRREEMRYTFHRPRIGAVGPNVCEICGSSLKSHDQLPYGIGAQQ